MERLGRWLSGDYAAYRCGAGSSDREFEFDQVVVARPVGINPTTTCEDLAKLGATMGEVRDIKQWDYFPHVSPETMKSGFYQEVEGLQDDQLTFAGELFTFSKVNHVMDHAERALEKL